jgi:hypothetical protein
MFVLIRGHIRQTIEYTRQDIENTEVADFIACVWLHLSGTIIKNLAQKLLGFRAVNK